MIVRDDALRVLSEHRTNELVVTTMSAAWEWPSYSKREDLDFPIRGVMGHAPSVGLGVAIAQPDRKVWIFNGDGSQLMYMGQITNIAHAGARNVVLFVFENSEYEITGGQPIPMAGRLDFAVAAKGLGIDRTYTFDDLATFESALPEVLGGEGPVFVCLKVVRGESVVAPRRKMKEMAERFRAAILEGS